jgi:hypothetical protein
MNVRNVLLVCLVFMLSLTLAVDGFAQGGSGFQPAPEAPIAVSSYRVPSKGASRPLSAPSPKNPASLNAARVMVSPCTSSQIQYIPLSLFGIAPISGVGNDTITIFDVETFRYAGALYSRIGMVSNGYAVVGGGDSQDITFFNTSLPSQLRPNNLLAPF